MMHVGFFCQCERHTRAALHEVMYIATDAEIIVDNINAASSQEGEDHFLMRAVALDTWATHILNRLDDIEEGRNHGFE